MRFGHPQLDCELSHQPQHLSLSSPSSLFSVPHFTNQTKYVFCGTALLPEPSWLTFPLQMAKHRDIKHFAVELVPWSLRLINIPLDAPYDEVESFLQKVGFASCAFYWDRTTKEALGTRNAGWCVVVFPLDGLAALAAVALSGRVFNGRTILATQAPSPQWYHPQLQQLQQQKQQQQTPKASQQSATSQSEHHQQEQPTTPVKEKEPVSVRRFDLAHHIVCANNICRCIGDQLMGPA